MQEINNDLVDFINLDDERLSKIREEVKKKLEEYRETMRYLSADVPISVLCLPSSIETILLNNGYLRVYDLFIATELTNIKGIGTTRFGQIKAALDKFLSMC